MKRVWWAIILATVLVGLVIGFAVLFPYNLRSEQTAARKADIPLTIAEIPWAPVPPARDAARWYAEFERRRNSHDFTPAEDAVWEKMDARRPLTATERATIIRAFATRRPMLEALHRAAAMPAYGHPKPVSFMKAPPSMEAFAHSREAAKLLREEARVLALQGRYPEAVRVQALGYGVARHMYQGYSMIAYLVGVAIEAITNAGLTGILQTAGPDATLAGAARKAISAAPEPVLAGYLRAEVPDNLDAFQYYRSWSDLKSGGGAATSNPLDRITVHAMRGPLAAGALHWQRRLIEAADQPADRRREAMRLVSDQVQWTGPPGPVMWQPRTLAFYGGIGMYEDRRRAQRAVLLAACDVLAWRARTGRFPARLEEALHSVPLDPFSGKPLGYRREGTGFVVYSVGERAKFAAKPGQADRGEAVFRYGH